MKEYNGCKDFNERVFPDAFPRYSISKDNSADEVDFNQSVHFKKKKLIECNLDSGAGFERDAAVAMFGFEVVRFAIDGHIADATDELLVRLEPTTFLQRTRMSSDVQRVVGVGRRDPSHTHARLHEDIIHR